MVSWGEYVTLLLFYLSWQTLDVVQTGPEEANVGITQLARTLPPAYALGRELLLWPAPQN